MLRRLLLPIVLGAALIAVPAAAIANTRPLTLKQGKNAIRNVFDQELALASGPVSHAHLSKCHRTGRLTVVCNSWADVNDRYLTLHCYKHYRAHRWRHGKVTVVESKTGKGNWRKYVHTPCKL